LRHTISLNVPIVVNPEVPTGLTQLADAVFKLEVTDVPEDIQSHLPRDGSHMTLLGANIPTRLSKMTIIRPVNLCASPRDPC
jgi:hypothetical protein